MEPGVKVEKVTLPLAVKAVTDVVARVEVALTVRLVIVVVGKAALAVTTSVPMVEEAKETLPKLVVPRTVKLPVTKPLPATVKVWPGVEVPIPRAVLLAS